MDVLKPKTALIIGITGQDGSYLAEYLLEKNYRVHGIKRRSSSFNTWRIDHLYSDRFDPKTRLFLHYSDLSDASSLIKIIQEVAPDEIYNLGAMSHVHISFDIPEYAVNIDGLGALRVLEAVRILGMKHTKIYQASTSELFGKVCEIPQTETTPFCPQSPYASAKLFAYWITRNYREAYGFFACNGILFNHESPRRGENFITQKVVRGAVAIARGQKNFLFLGNLNAQRDFGHTKDYVRAMHQMLQHSKADDYVIASGKNITIRTFVTKVFSKIGINLCFVGQDLSEKGVIESLDRDRLASCVGPSSSHLQPGQELIKIKREYFRPNEVDLLIGDASKARNVLGWIPEYSLDDLIDEMLQAEIKRSLTVSAQRMEER